MALVTQTYNLDLVPDISKITVVHCSQNDTSRHIVFQLFNEGIKYTIPTNITARIEGTKPNGAFSIDITCTTSTVEFDLQKSMNDCIGSTTCAIILTDTTGLTVGTAEFILQVNAGGIVGEIDLYSTDFPHYISEIEVYRDQTLSYKNSAYNSAETAAKYAERAEAAADSAEAAADSAEAAAELANRVQVDVSEARRWAVGDSGSGDEIASDVNSAFYYATLAKAYSSFTAPKFYIDYADMNLYMTKNDSSNINFILSEDKHLILEVS